ncbi:hypothetical protein FRC01_009462 [Tulasnella sp. 417]|nr:hypothetical protein FRC01_009462 [Tulasnella sp. 417]
MFLPGMTAFPRLRRLEIDGFPCELSPPGLLLNNVRSLNLVDVLNITMEELLGVLHNSPFLERLELGRSPTACPSKTIVTPVHLPRLMALHLIYMPIQVSNFFLKTVHAPNCSELVIVSQFPESPDNVVKDSLFTSNTQHFIPVLQTLLTRGRHKDIEVTHFSPQEMAFLLNFHDRPGDGDYDGLLDHGVVRLDFKFHSVQQIEQTVHWLVHCLGLDMPKISIRLFVGGFDEARWMDILDSRTTITHFAFYTLPHPDAIRPSPILTHMAQPTLSRWPLHEMEEFIFGVAEDDKLQDEAALKMLQERYGSSDANPGDSSGGPSNGRSYPKPLRKIRLAVDGRTSSYMLDEVQKILPEAKASLFLETSLW